LHEKCADIFYAVKQPGNLRPTPCSTAETQNYEIYETNPKKVLSISFFRSFRPFGRFCLASPWQMLGTPLRAEAVAKIKLN
jgi:hypothetical protein